ncbi:MAG: DUF2115 domain-containing protein [Methanoregula sp.]|jgi:uncharacterized protein (UPF0305 family)|nr:DUF2115 domain-containing protein [Methanoregula sp.]
MRDHTGDGISAIAGDEKGDMGTAIRDTATRLQSARTKGELGTFVAQEIATYTMSDLQIIGGRLNSDIEKLPSPYREAIRPYFRKQLFGKHHELLSLYRSGAFGRMNDPIRDRDSFDKFCAMLPEGCLVWEDTGDRNPYFRNPKNRLFYYLIAAFTMFVLEEPGHPVGMPFPGGFTVEQRGREFYCLIRDKEKDVFYSICNFCPALQTEEQR